MEVQPREPYQLGKHMAKIEVGDSGVVLLRPRYALSANQTQNILASLKAWQQTTGSKIQVLLVPHFFDVLACEAPPWKEKDASASDLPSAITPQSAAT